MRSMGATGVWELFVPDARAGDRYKLVIHGAGGGSSLRADPLAREAEVPPATASIVAAERHVWADDDWMAARGDRHRVDRAMSVYEVHLGSWRRTGSTTAAWPRRCPPTWPASASRTSS